MASTSDVDKVLIDASAKGNLPMVEHLVKKGADVTAKDELGYTSLHFASVYGYLHVVEHLVKKGANTEAKDKVRQANLLFI